MFLYKNRKFRKGRLHGITSTPRLGLLKTGTFGLKVMENGYLTADQLEAARKAIKYSVNKFRFVDPIFIRVVPLLSRSKKKKGLRMGGAKGGFYRFVYRARRGTILFEVKNVLRYQIFQKLRRVMVKFPVKLALVVLKR